MKSGVQNVALVAGGAGFIGSHLCDRLLADGATVICLDSLLTGRRANVRHLEGQERFEMIEHDIIDPLPELARRAKPITHIYNLACAASPPHYQDDPEHTMLTNVVGTINLLRLAEKVGARLLLASTSEIYGEPEVHPQPEDYRGSVNCTGPRSCYDEGKRAAESMTFDYIRAGKCEARVARIFNTYGPRMRADDGRVVSNVVCQAIEGDDITMFGDGEQTRSFCYVDETADALIRLMMVDGIGEVPVNIGNPEELSVRDLIAKVLQMTGSRSRIQKLPLPIDDPTRRRPDISRAKALLGWEPKVDLDHGLKATIEWFEDEEHRLVRQPAPIQLVAAAE